MRDPKRIERVLALIKEIWDMYPDLRLCQLLGNCFEAGDNYHKEDNLLEQKLKEVYLGHKEKVLVKKKEVDTSHGSPHDRGSADAYYRREKRPHKWLDACGVKEVILTDPEEIEAYNHGYDNETSRN